MANTSGAADGNRTRITGLEGRCSAVERLRHIGTAPRKAHTSSQLYREALGEDNSYVHCRLVTSAGIEPARQG